MSIKAIITAGGTSSRYGNKNKLLENVNGKEVIRHTVDAFLNIPEIEEIIICANASIIEILKLFFIGNPKIKIIEGGATRQASVYNGLQAAKKCDYILIHHGARPMISEKIIKKVIQEVKTKKALTVAAKTIDTIKEVDGNLKITKTIDRTHLFNTQTPQAFSFGLIKEIHEELKGENFTDDAGMVEQKGYDVYIVEGDYKNIKITTKTDLEIAKTYLT
ncbi:MAG: 2-C-methyl-D-erythritol 4-phosphate cytidylyltransferase [bacterium]|nr:2-C-methyl-D-erythritol 4-phosphate cytidylyltransferase [bacterium]